MIRKIITIDEEKCNGCGASARAVGREGAEPRLTARSDDGEETDRVETVRIARTKVRIGGSGLRIQVTVGRVSQPD